MKKAEEWYESHFCGLPKTGIIRDVEAIQLDAIKSALEYAAKECNSRKYNGPNLEAHAFVMACHEMGKALLTAAQNLEQVMKEL